VNLRENDDVSLKKERSSGLREFPRRPREEERTRTAKIKRRKE
jgi:hypothetical protein